MGAVDVSLLKPELVFFDCKANNSTELFAELKEKLEPGGYLNPTWEDAILTRENLYPTGMEFDAIKVAIPHVEPQHIAKPYIAIVKAAHPIEFRPMADMVDHPVQAQLVVNLGLVDHDEAQVAVLQAMMGIFMDETACQKILAQTSAQGMVDTFCELFG